MNAKSAHDVLVCVCVCVCVGGFVYVLYDICVSIMVLECGLYEGGATPVARKMATPTQV